MYIYDEAAKLVEQPRRHPTSLNETKSERRPRTLLMRSEAAALLQMSERVLERWRAIGYGPRPILSVDGYRYVAEQVERLAAIAPGPRMFAIARMR